ncbi:MAG: hypothetical protein JJU08_00345, partial [Rhodobacteraceae bacterium]|nr:hypothetical protein [Paracoccaceae bacterium]
VRPIHRKQTKPPTYLFKFPKISNSTETKTHVRSAIHKAHPHAYLSLNLKPKTAITLPHQAAPDNQQLPAAGEALSRQSNIHTQEGNLKNRKKIDWRTANPNKYEGWNARNNSGLMPAPVPGRVILLLGVPAKQSGGPSGPPKA